MVGAGPGASKSQSPTPQPSQPAAPTRPSDSLFPTPAPLPTAPSPAPAIASAAKWGAVAVLGLIALIAVVWVVLSNRTRASIVDAPRSSAGTAAPEPSVKDAPPASGSLLDINTAAAAQLEHLPGIGPAIAQRIVDDRTRHGRYTSIDELDRVQGIGKKTIEKLRPYVTVK